MHTFGLFAAVVSEMRDRTVAAGRNPAEVEATACVYVQLPEGRGRTMAEQRGAVDLPRDLRLQHVGDRREDVDRLRGAVVDPARRLTRVLHEQRGPHDLRPVAAGDRPDALALGERDAVVRGDDDERQVLIKCFHHRGQELRHRGARCRHNDRGTAGLHDSSEREERGASLVEEPVNRPLRRGLGGRTVTQQFENGCVPRSGTHTQITGSHEIERRKQAAEDGPVRSG